MSTTTVRTPQETQAEMLAHLKQAIESYMEAFRTNHAAEFAGKYEEEAMVMASGKAPCRGKEAVERFVEGVIGAAQVVDVRTSAEAVKAGTALGYRAGIFDLDLKTADGAVASTQNKGIEIWRRQADGVWKIRRDMWTDASPAEPPKQQLLMELEAASERTARCMVAGDLTGAAECYAEDVILMPPEEAPVAGWSAAKEWIRKWLETFEMVDARIRYSNPLACGDFVYCGDCRFDFDMRLRADGSPVRSSGHGVLLLRREPGGLLKVVWDLWPKSRPEARSAEWLALKGLMEERGLQYERDVIANNLEGWASYFAPDAMVMPNNAPPLQNRQELLDYGRAYLDAFSVESLKFETLEMEMAGDWAYRLLEYRNRMTAKLTGERHLVLGKGLEIWRNQGDTWQVSHDVWTIEPSADNVQDPARSMGKEEFLAMARARVAAQNEVFLKNDPALWAGAYYADEARLGGDDGEPIYGRKAFREAIGSMYFAPNTYRAAEMEVLDAEPLGEYGLVRLRLNFELEPKAGGARVNYTGPCVELWKRQADGSWLTVDGIWTSDKPWK